MDLGLRGRVCAVTGGSSGIGLATAEALVSEGASVLLVARSAQRLAAAAESCPDGPGTVDSLALDVTAAGAGTELMTVLDRRFGKVDALVNAAGTARVHGLDAEEAEWNEQWELNVTAPRLLMDALVPRMIADGGGAVVNVCSSAGRRPSSTYPAYAVAKRGELALTEVYAQRFAASGVRINAVAPGPTATPLWLRPGGLLDQVGAPVDDDRQEALARRGANLPLGRYATADEVAAAIVLLIASKPRPSGATWSVDGGHVADVFP